MKGKTRIAAWTGLLIVFAAATALAVDGLVSTVDGRKFRGEVTLTNDALVVKSREGTLATISATNIAHAQFTTNFVVARTRGSGNGLLGIYYSSTNFTGKTVMRLDETVDFDWQDKEPILDMPRDGFSVRWMGQIEAPTTDTYTLSFGTDEGGRLYLDDTLAADNWSNQQYGETNVTVNLKAGERRKLKLEFFDIAGIARARLLWSTPSMAKTIVPEDRLYAASFDETHRGGLAALAGSRGLLGTYYNDSNFSSNSISRIDPEIDFHWQGQPPAPEIASNSFSVRWSGNLLVTNAGEYHFYIMAGDSLRFFVNDKLISNPWMAALEQELPITLTPAERCELRLEVRVTNNLLPLKLSWSGPGFAKTLLSRESLSPGIAPSHEPPLGTGPTLPAGIVLLNGAIIDAQIQSASASSIRLRGVLAKQSLATTKVTRIHAKPITGELAGAIPRGRSGVLLKNRDFIDGDFGGIENGRVKIESVLFGNRTFDLAKDVVVIVLRGSEPQPWRYSVTAQDGTVLYGKTLQIATNRVGLAEAPELSLPAAELTQIARQ